MDETTLESLKFPIGRHTTVSSFDRAAVEDGILEIEAFPARLRARLEGVADSRLDAVYRPGGWTELADSRGPVEPALRLLEAMHGRWVALMRTMDDGAFRKSFRHPETGSMMTLFDSRYCLPRRE